MTIRMILTVNENKLATVQKAGPIRPRHSTGRVAFQARAAPDTPDMHRVHHSVDIEESNHNFGIILPWWDRLFRTYRAEPRHGHEAMRIGLDWLRHEGGMPELFLLPFKARFPPARRETID